MRYLKYILIFLIPFSLLSCSDWLDDRDYGDEIVANSFYGGVEDLEILLNGAYAALLGHDGSGFASTPFLYSALNSDMLKPYPPNQDKIPEELLSMYKRENNMLGENSYVYKMIDFTNMAVNNANIVIDKLENGDLVDDPAYKTQQERMRGEAYLIRAMAYFEQTRLFGEQYKKETATSAMAGYYQITPVYDKDDLIKQRITVAEAYKKLIDDARNAIELLPETFNANKHNEFYNTRRLNQDAGRALLAKIYFQMNDFENCYKMLSDLLGSETGNSEKYPLTPSLRL